MKSNFTQALQELTGFEIGHEKADENAATNSTGNPQYNASSAFTPDTSFEKASSFSVDTSSLKGFNFNISEASSHISPSMSLIGNLTSNDDILIEGKVKGDISTSGNIKVGNVVLGNIKAQNLVFDTARVKGNISAENSVDISELSVLVGDISCEDLILSGKVNGNLDVANSVSLKGDALVVGNITTDLFTTDLGSHIIGSIFARKQDSEFDIDKIFDFGGDF